jgi:hypothetical protein
LRLFHAILPTAFLAALAAILSPTANAQSRPFARATVVAEVSPAALVDSWIFEMAGDGQPQRVRLTLSQDSLRGQVYGQPFAAVLTNNRLTFAVGDYRWRATLTNDTLSGWLGVGFDSSRWFGVRDARARHRRQ